MAQRVSDPELVKGVGIVDRHIGDDEIRRDEQPEHVFANISLPDEFAGGSAIDRDVVLVAQAQERGPDQRPFDIVEIDSFFRAKRSDEKSAHTIASERRVSRPLSDSGSPAILHSMIIQAPPGNAGGVALGHATSVS